MESTSSISNAAAPLESALYIEELGKRPSRPPNYEVESRALTELTAALADSPRTIFQTLAEVALRICCAGSAGISLLEDDGQAFYRAAAAGAWNPSAENRMPRNGTPCGIVIDRNAPQLFKRPERHFSYLARITPPIEEALLIPFQMEGKAIGTLWVIAHDKARQFDGEDLRIMTSVARLTSAAHQTVTMLNTVIKADEILRETDRRKDEFLALLAHELRNPLTPIKNASQILRLPGVDAESHQAALDMLDRQIGLMIRLVDELLDVSHITRGKIALRKQRTELAMIVEYAVETVRSLCMSRDHNLTIRLPSKPVYLNADPARLTQVISNLLSNAYKFTQLGGQIQLTVEREGTYAIIRVQDNGIGIAKDKLPRIFELFTQVDTSLERAQSGLGIGLSLVKNLVQMHDGTVEVRSAGPGKGSEFIVRLPVAAELSECSDPPQHESSAPEQAAAPSHVLIVDDNRDSAESLAKLLKMSGHEVYTAGDGLEGVRAAAKLHPDVVLLDIGLPELNGYEAARRIREQQKDNPPVLIAITGWDQEEDRRRSKEAGFNAHLVKPIDLPTVTRLLADLNVLRQH